MLGSIINSIGKLIILTLHYPLLQLFVQNNLRQNILDYVDFSVSKTGTRDRTISQTKRRPLAHWSTQLSTGNWKVNLVNVRGTIVILIRR